jgi:hypothetical protein
MTTSTTTSIALFQPRSTGSALRAAAILGLCAALLGGFVAHASRVPSAPAGNDAVASAFSHGRSV